MHVDTFGDSSALLDDSTSRLRALDAVPRHIADHPPSLCSSHQPVSKQETETRLKDTENSHQTPGLTFSLVATVPKSARGLAPLNRTRHAVQGRLMRISKAGHH